MQGLVPVHTHRTDRVTGSAGREGAKEVGGGIGVGVGNVDVNGDEDGDGAGVVMVTGTGVEANEGAQDGNEDGSGNEAGNGEEEGDPWTNTGWERGRVQ